MTRDDYAVHHAAWPLGLGAFSGERVSYFARPMYPCVSVSIFHAALRPTR